MDSNGLMRPIPGFDFKWQERDWWTALRHPLSKMNHGWAREIKLAGTFGSPLPTQTSRCSLILVQNPHIIGTHPKISSRKKIPCAKNPSRFLSSISIPYHGYINNNSSTIGWS
jgi:hypothetical protein